MDHPCRIGDTVRRARRGNTPFVQRVLRRLEDEDLAWAPRPLGIDELGREVVSWIPGATAASADEIDVLPLVAMVRQLHDLTVDLVDGGFECVIHDDVQPRNVVVRDGLPVGLIDWEQARPGRRVEDVAKLCWSMVEPTPDSTPVEIGGRWRDIAGVYGLETLDALLPTVVDQIQSCAEDIERGVATGSVRHRVLAGRGDHRALRVMHGWTVANEQALRMGIEI